MWDLVSSIKRFTPMSEVFDIIGKPQFRLGTRTTYYLGNGFFMGFSDIKFRIEDLNRVEYGDVGEYAISIYFFQNRNEVEKVFKLKNETYDFGYERIENNIEFIDGIKIGDTFEKVTSILRPIHKQGYYNEGEVRSLNAEREFIFQHNYVNWKNTEMYFFGKSKKTALTGFEYSLL